MQDLIRKLLADLGEDPNREGLVDTPKRVEKAYKFLTSGYQADIDNANANTGALIECCAGPRRGVPPRPDRAFRGQVGARDRKSVV